mgnify:CR=1 FL=1
MIENLSGTQIGSSLLDVRLDYTYQGSYFEQRGVSQKVFQEFYLGHVISAIDILPSEIIGSPAFPVYDENGYFVGWVFRPGHTDFKYRFHGLKTFDYVYGLPNALSEIMKNKSVIIVEGPFDVLLAHSIGIKNVVAVFGSSISVNQTLLLGSYTDKFIIALDSDKAGLEGAARSSKIINRILPEVSIEMLPVYPHKDFADFSFSKLKCNRI